MVNNFFNSFEYITLLEASAISGNKSATMYKLMSKSRKLLGEKVGVLRNPKDDEANQKLVDEICKVMYENLMSFTSACEHLGYTYHFVNKLITEKQRIQISDTRCKFKISYKTKRKWYA